MNIKGSQTEKNLIQSFQGELAGDALYNGRINSYKECLTLSKKIGYNLRKQYEGF